jgi:hypothetical protein
MPNLPGSNPEIDIEMLNYVLTNIHPDQVKMYPTTITPFTKILEDYKEGKYVPYNNDDLERVIMYWMINVHPWIRNNRIVRDIPHYYIVDGVESPNQKQEFDEIMITPDIKKGGSSDPMSQIIFMLCIFGGCETVGVIVIVLYMIQFLFEIGYMIFIFLINALPKHDDNKITIVQGTLQNNNKPYFIFG